MNSAMDANSILGREQQADPYDALPDPVKMIVSRREYLWLADSQKATLEQDLCEPDPEY